MVTILAFNMGKTVVENAAVKISVDNLPHIRPEKAILLGKALIVDLFQRFWSRILFPFGNKRWLTSKLSIKYSRPGI